MEESFSLKVRIRAWKEESTWLVVGRRGRRQNKVCSDQTVKLGADLSHSALRPDSTRLVCVCQKQRLDEKFSCVA